jgi:hypothetical protein
LRSRLEDERKEGPMEKGEWETTVTYDHLLQEVRIYTTVPRHINKLRKDERAKVTGDEGDAVNATINAADFDPLSGFKRKSKPMDPEQREAAIERLKKAREAR